jgi:ribose transport system substrate-binding protein
MKSARRLWCVTQALSVGVAGALVLSACGGSTVGAEGPAGDSSAIVAESTNAVDKFFANDGAPLEVPAIASNLDGKRIMYLSAGLSSPSGSAGVKTLTELSKDLGFSLIPFDGQFTPSKYQEGMRQAISQKVDALIVYGVDCPGNEAALKEVRAASIPIIGLQSVDCSELSPGVEPMFDSQTLYQVDGKGTAYETWAANGVAQADYLISKLKGNVKVIQFDVPDFLVTSSLGKAFAKRMSECATCQVVETIQVGVADFGPGLQQKAEQALLKHPEANAVAINYDDLVTLGISAAIKGSGRGDDILTIAGTGYEATMDLIRKKQGLDAGWVQNHEWDHYAVADTLIRHFAGKEGAKVAVPVILYDREHNMADSGEFIPKTDFKSAFHKAWAKQ